MLLPRREYYPWLLIGARLWGEIFKACSAGDIAKLSKNPCCACQTKKSLWTCRIKFITQSPQPLLVVGSFFFVFFLKHPLIIQWGAIKKKKHAVDWGCLQRLYYLILSNWNSFGSLFWGDRGRRGESKKINQNIVTNGTWKCAACA